MRIGKIAVVICVVLGTYTINSTIEEKKGEIEEVFNAVQMKSSEDERVIMLNPVEFRIKKRNKMLDNLKKKLKSKKNTLKNEDEKIGKFNRVKTFSSLGRDKDSFDTPKVVEEIVNQIENIVSSGTQSPELAASSHSLPHFSDENIYRIKEEIYKILEQRVEDGPMKTNTPHLSRNILPESDLWKQTKEETDGIVCEKMGLYKMLEYTNENNKENCSNLPSIEGKDVRTQLEILLGKEYPMLFGVSYEDEVTGYLFSHNVLQEMEACAIIYSKTIEKIKELGEIIDKRLFDFAVFRALSRVMPYSIYNSNLDLFHQVFYQIVAKESTKEFDRVFKAGRIRVIRHFNELEEKMKSFRNKVEEYKKQRSSKEGTEEIKRIAMKYLHDCTNFLEILFDYRRGNSDLSDYRRNRNVCVDNVDDYSLLGPSIMDEILALLLQISEEKSASWDLKDWDPKELSDSNFVSPEELLVVLGANVLVAEGTTMKKKFLKALVELRKKQNYFCKRRKYAEMLVKEEEESPPAAEKPIMQVDLGKAEDSKDYKADNYPDPNEEGRTLGSKSIISSIYYLEAEEKMGLLFLDKPKYSSTVVPQKVMDKASYKHLQKLIKRFLFDWLNSYYMHTIPAIFETVSKEAKAHLGEVAGSGFANETKFMENLSILEEYISTATKHYSGEKTRIIKKIQKMCTTLKDPSLPAYYCIYMSDVFDKKDKKDKTKSKDICLRFLRHSLLCLTFHRTNIALLMNNLFQNLKTTPSVYSDYASYTTPRGMVVDGAVLSKPARIRDSSPSTDKDQSKAEKESPSKSKEKDNLMLYMNENGICELPALHIIEILIGDQLENSMLKKSYMPLAKRIEGKLNCDDAKKLNFFQSLLNRLSKNENAENYEKIKSNCIELINTSYVRRPQKKSVQSLHIKKK